MKWSEPPPGLKKEEGDSKKFGDCPLISYAMEGFWTFPDFRHVVQTRMRRMVPSTTARTRCKFGFQRRLVTLCACETLLPKRGPLPQISQTLAMISPYILLRQAIKTFFLFRCQPGGIPGSARGLKPTALTALVGSNRAAGFSLRASLLS